MRIPHPKPPIDVDDLREALAAGETGAAFARRTGYTRGAVYDLLRPSGIKPARPARKVRDGTDAILRTIWGSLLERCEKPDSRLYRLDGARGLRVCREWHDFVAFRNWVRQAGYRDGRAIRLRSRSRGYRPSNCSWTSRSEVITEGWAACGGGVVLVTAFGETKSAAAWACDPRAMVRAETKDLKLSSPPLWTLLSSV